MSTKDALFLINDTSKIFQDSTFLNPNSKVTPWNRFRLVKVQNRHYPLLGKVILSFCFFLCSTVPSRSRTNCAEYIIDVLTTNSVSHNHQFWGAVSVYKEPIVQTQEHKFGLVAFMQKLVLVMHV